VFGVFKNCLFILFVESRYFCLGVGVWVFVPAIDASVVIVPTIYCFRNLLVRVQVPQIEFS
jgi:hypothetical protein